MTITPVRAGGTDITHFVAIKQDVTARRYAERRTDLRGRDYYWMGWRGLPDNAPAGTDLYAVRHGKISVTPLHIDLTHRPTLHALKGLLGGPPPRGP